MFTYFKKFRYFPPPVSSSQELPLSKGISSLSSNKRQPKNCRNIKRTLESENIQDFFEHKVSNSSFKIVNTKFPKFRHPWLK